MQLHILELAMCVEYLAIKVKIVQIELTTSKVHSHICKACHHQHFYLCLVQTHPHISLPIYSLQTYCSVLMQQLTVDYVMSQHASDEITTRLNEIAEENGLIKQKVHKIYNTATDVLGKAKNKTLTASPNDRTNNHKQPNQGSKSVRFISRDHDTKSTTKPA